MYANPGEGREGNPNINKLLKNIFGGAKISLVTEQVFEEGDRGVHFVLTAHIPKLLQKRMDPLSFCA